MNRRTLLRRSAALGAIALAGCSGDGGRSAPGEPTPTPRGPTGFGEFAVETTATDCAGGSEGSADATFDEDPLQLVATGTILAPNPCHEASFSGVRYDNSSDELRLTIATKADTSVDACRECIGAIDYEATIGLEGQLPGTVVVEHESVEGTTEVARIPREDG